MLALPVIGVAMSSLSSCTEVDSSLVEYEEDYYLNSPNDTVYSVAGILGKMQALGDRTVLLGELRGDLTVLTPEANSYLQEVADFNAPFGTNPYNQPKDYYAVIQNCNYFIAKADSLLEKRGEKVFEKELAAVHAFRAWTYFQLALNYGKVPFFTEPLLKEKDAYPDAQAWADIDEICEFFIEDLKPYVDTKQPQYINGNSYLPVRLLLGDMCLWAGRYADAAQYYHDFLNHRDQHHPLSVCSVRWDDVEFLRKSDSYSSALLGEELAYIPMEEEEYDGVVSDLPDIFNSTEENNYYCQATYSEAYKLLSQSQRYTMVYADIETGLRDTISPDTIQIQEEISRGDLRLSVIYDIKASGISNINYSTIRQNYAKIFNSGIILYRLAHVYLRYAEALNRAGFPQAAFAVLKYGLCNENNSKYIGEEERTRAGELINFNPTYFLSSSTYGLHARGCGNVEADTLYAIPACVTREDSILAVEDLIMEESALETAGEGLRYYDLMRIALRRNKTEYLADKIALRKGKAKYDPDLYQKLLNKENWYLPLP